MLTMTALEDAKNRAIGLPGIVVLHGPSGYGKSTAAAFAQQETGAYYFSMHRTWDWRDLVEVMATEMGLVVKGRISKVTAAIVEQLSRSGRMLFLDEAHILVQSKKGRGLIWDLYEDTQGVILLLGEETLPQALQDDESVDGRVLDRIGAQPASVADARTLGQIYSPGVEIADDLLRAFATRADGSVRRIIVNLDRVRKEAKKMGWNRVDLALWGDREIYTGKAAAARFGAGGRKSEGRRK
jgi:hypothetical protein